MKRCGCLGFLTQVSGWCLLPFPVSALKMWGVSLRPVQMAKQESEERGAADTLRTHPSHCWWPHRNNCSPGEAKKCLKQRKFKSQRRNAVYLPNDCREAHWSLCVFILSEKICTADDNIYINIFLLLVCLHSYCACQVITFQTFRVFVNKSKP